MIDNSSSSDFGSGFTDKSFDSVAAGFKDENVCGEGASCVVYRIKHNDIHVAVKRLRRELIHKAEFVSSYRKEFKIGQRLKHDALPVYRNLRDDLEEVYIEMDYIDGITVEDFIKTQAGREYLTSVENVRRFLKELLNVVSYLHRSGVIHCDLKPANIMLRHSDRSVMLLDLDKSYSDILSSNSGGTKSFSDPVLLGEKPTAYKDISAIGRIFDVIAEKVPGFPLSRLKRFRKECLNENFSERRLSAALERKAYRNWFIFVGILVLVTATPILIRNLSTRNIQTDSPAIVPEVHQETSGNDTPVTTDDTVTSVSPQPKTIPPRVTQTEPTASTSKDRDKPQEIVIDIDTKMADFTSKVEEAYNALSSGINPKQLQECLYDLAKSHSTTYQSVVKDIKIQYPDVPGIDVELAVARAYERSNIGKLYIKFNEAVADTLRKRDKDSDDDL